MNGEKINFDIIWDSLDINPSVQLKFGIKRKIFPLKKIETNSRSNLLFKNEYIELKGKWDNSPSFGSLLSLKITNISDSSIRITRLVFPTENGLDNFLKDFDSMNISFLRNGYQSWSTSRSYRVYEKPLRPWLQLVSLTSSNLANLPSNTAGNLSSEMYSVITDLRKNEAFLVGQGPPFNQFFYIRLIIYRKESKKNYFELVFDFGRKMLKASESITLDSIIMAKGEINDIQSKYFKFIKNQMNINILKTNIKGWSTWYYYYNKINPQIIYDNIKIIKKKNLDINLIQIDDGYQKHVGDWFDLEPQFQNKMEEISNKIKEEGFIPAIWLAPFIAEKDSTLYKEFPDYFLRTETGKPIVAGYNPLWKSKFYYALDVTNPRCEEYIRKVIKTIVHQWGFKCLKLDFLFAGCMRGGNHNNYRMSRTEVLKYGMRVIKEEAGNNTILIGCGMPLSAGIGNVNIMRVGPDTAPFWKKIMGTFLQTGAMIGCRNSIRNFMVRSFMNKNLWINDPDCLMIRNKKTKLTENERKTQINAIITAGGTLFYSDNFSELSDEIFEEMKKINMYADLCFKGDAIPVDVMEREIPEIYYNTAGFLGIFNFRSITVKKKINLFNYDILKYKIRTLVDVWTNEEIDLDLDGIIELKMPPHGSRLFKILV
ncbi:MAG TPA: alpha-galactosidase [Spirochaetota bacterium]|nr:alpha-galactosidase [Spirochaetota bacterium]HOL58213.1 alpha-galactosidase [Spirochaetota bacterium]HPP04990.1 alpha-galactosidase [Spirochaetota bacterium]